MPVDRGTVVEVLDVIEQNIVAHSLDAQAEYEPATHRLRVRIGDRFLCCVCLQELTGAGVPSHEPPPSDFVIIDICRPCDAQISADRSEKP